MAANEFGIARSGTTEAPRFTAELMTRPIVVSGEVDDPLGVEPVTTIKAMTLCAPDAQGYYRPIRLTLANADATAYVDDEIGVAETAMFAVGAIVGVVGQADPAGDSVTLGVVAEVGTGTIRLEAAALVDVAEGDIIIVEDTEQMGRAAVLLRRDVPTLDVLTQQRVSAGAVGVIAGQARLEDVICSGAGGIIEDRIRAELPLCDLM